MDPIANISDWLEPVRFLLGDHGPTPEFADATIESGLIFFLKGGRLRRHAVVMPGRTVSPAVTDPNLYMLLALLVAKHLAGSRPDRRSFRSRAWAESEGGRGQLIFQLEEELHRLEGGAMFEAWGSLGSWLQGVGGLPGTCLWSHLTRVQVEAPVDSVSVPSLSRGGAM